MRHCRSSWVKRAGASDKPFGNRLWFELRAFGKALPRLPLAMYKRCGSRPWFRRSDREVIRVSNSVNQYRQERVDRGIWSHRPDPARGLQILVLCARLPRLNTDGSWILFNLLKELSTRHRVTVFSLIDHAEEDAQADPLREFCAEVVTYVRPHGGGAANLHGQLPDRLARDYSHPHVRQALQHLIFTSHYDVLQVEYAEMAHAVRDEIKGLPTVYTCHEPMSVFHERIYRQAEGFGDKWKEWWAWSRNMVHEFKVLKRFRHIVTLSDADERLLHSYNKGLRITSIPSGIDIAAHELPADIEEGPGVVFVGYYRHPPNVDGAVWLAREVMPLVQKEIPEAWCKLVGKDPAPEVQELDELPGVEVTGFVESLKPYLAEASVVAVPIRTGGGLRGKVLEAWASRKAIVAHEVACEGFACEDGKHLIKASDAQAFADGIIRCIRDAALRRKLGDAGHALTEERYSCAAMARKYEGVYAEVLGIQPGSGDPSRNGHAGALGAPPEVPRLVLEEDKQKSEEVSNV